jgi:ribosomal protein L18E
LNFEAHSFSKSAKEKIEKAQGKCTILRWEDVESIEECSKN